MSGMHWNVGLQPWPGLLLVPHHCCLWTTDGADSLAWIWPGAWDKQELTKHLEWRFEAVNLQGTTWTSSFAYQEMLRFVAVLSCSLLVPSMANKCFVVAWCGLALLARGGPVCNSVCHVLSLLPLVLSWLDFCWTFVEPEHMRQQIGRPAHTVYIVRSCILHVLHLCFEMVSIFNIYWTRFILIAIFTIYCKLYYFWCVQYHRSIPVYFDASGMHPLHPIATCEGW